MTHYPEIYWNCGCLIVNSGGNDIGDNMDNDEDDENDDDDDKKKTKATDYGKIATAIGSFQSAGIKILLPNINSSKYTFIPDAKNNVIIYGLRGITRISSDFIKTIIDNRPYVSLQDFINKLNPNKTQMVSLIKAGTFDQIENIPRTEIMYNYLSSVADKKQRLTLQNMQMLIDKNLIPEEMKFYEKLFLFNKFLKTQKESIYYQLNIAAINFINNYFETDIIDNGNKIMQRTWDNLYKKTMEPMRVYLKNNMDILLQKLNNSLVQELIDKYAQGNISSWEMDSLSFYYHDHELLTCQDQYDNFFTLSEEPEIINNFIKNDQTINIYKLHHIIGTVIDKDKIRNTINLLTPTGVVIVKIYKNQFALYDKQLSQRGNDGKKHVIEKSWLSRGTKLMIQGIRRGNDFIPKKTKNSAFPIISKIINIKNNNQLEFQFDRKEVDD